MSRYGSRYAYGHQYTGAAKVEPSSRLRSDYSSLRARQYESSSALSSLRDAGTTARSASQRSAVPSYSSMDAGTTSQRSAVPSYSSRDAGTTSQRSAVPSYSSREAGTTSQRSAVPRYSSRGLTTELSSRGRTSTVIAHLTPLAASSETHPKGTCDKCDGPHLTDACPIFKKKREDHPDATRRRNQKDIGGDGGDGPGRYLSSARVVAQPGDGSCLFHSLAHGLGSSSARVLRREIAEYIRTHQDLEIAGDALKDWVKWDSGTSVSSYCGRMAVSGWGGGIEMAAFSRMKRVNVHVYERCGGRASFKRVSAFDVPGASKTIRVLYRGGVHFDALSV